MEDIFKKLGSSGDVILSKSEVAELVKELDILKAKARDGEAYRNELQADVTRLYAIVDPELPMEAVKSVTEKMTLAELKAFKQVYEKKSARLGKGVPQLGKVKDEVTSKKNNAYKGI